MFRKKKFFVCSTCGSDDVRLDAYAVWDVDEQQWVLSHTFGQAFCEACDGETSLVTVPYKGNEHVHQESVLHP